MFRLCLMLYDADFIQIAQGNLPTHSRFVEDMLTSNFTNKDRNAKPIFSRHNLSKECLLVYNGSANMKYSYSCMGDLYYAMGDGMW